MNTSPANRSTKMAYQISNGFCANRTMMYHWGKIDTDACPDTANPKKQMGIFFNAVRQNHSPSGTWLFSYSRKTWLRTAPKKLNGRHM